MGEGRFGIYVYRQESVQRERGLPRSLTTRGNNKVDEMFVLRDTLLCYCSEDMAPLYFRKGAREGKRYTVDEVWYDYSGGKCNLTQKRLRKDGTSKTIHNTREECVYDMLNIFSRARSFNPEGWKKGNVVNIPIADGNGIDKAQLVYNGKSTIKADNGKKYRCLELSYKELDDGKWTRRLCASTSPTTRTTSPSASTCS